MDRNYNETMPEDEIELSFKQQCELDFLENAKEKINNLTAELEQIMPLFFENHDMNELLFNIAYENNLYDYISEDL